MRLNHPIVNMLTGRLIWLVFAVVFFYSGLFTTEWLLEPEQFAGGWRWILVALFPILVPAFFVVNRRYGCASGACLGRSCSTEKRGLAVKRMPGA